MYNTYVILAVIFISAIIVILAIMAFGYKEAHDVLLRSHENLRRRYNDHGNDHSKLCVEMDQLSEDYNSILQDNAKLLDENKNIRVVLEEVKYTLGLLHDTLSNQATKV